MKTINRTIALTFLLAIAFTSNSHHGLLAQTAPGQWSSWWFGGYGGVNINLFNGAMTNLSTTNPSVGLPAGFTGGSGFGLAVGGLVEYNSGGLLGGRIQLGYDNRAVIFSDVNLEKLSASPAYLGIDPALRVNLMDRFLHLTVGPTIGINLAKGYNYTSRSNASSTADLANTRGLLLGGELSVGYDIPLAGPDAATQILLTPFAAFRLGQGVTQPASGSTDKFGLTTIRAGLQAKFAAGPPPIPPPPPADAVQYTVRAPNVVTESRKLNETFPLRNYVFFDAGSTELPERYKKLSPQEAVDFKEASLKTSAETGGQDPLKVRSVKQMDVYYNVLNVLGERLRANTAATVSLTGAANGSADKGRQMAESVKNYLVTSFGIDAGRIQTDGRPMPSAKTGSGATPKEDRALVDAENYRVEFTVNPPDLMRPVTIITTQEQPLDNDIVVNVTSDTMATWSVDVTERGGATKTYGPFTGASTRIDSKALLGTNRDGRYTVNVKGLTKSGRETTGSPTDVRLVRADAEEEQTGNRYSILFEFDDSKTVKTYENFLRQVVAPAIPDGAAVIIHGHTDNIGETEYNLKLSQRRCEDAQNVLKDELDKTGKKVTFDSYGFGEEDSRSLFNNNQPEQRFYNRTVVIEVVPK